MLVVLDGVEDPHNLGAVIRTAHAAGADAIVVPERRAAGLTETVAKAAAGALEYLPVARVTNINRTLDELEEARFLDLRSGRARAIRITTRSIMPSARWWCSAPKARVFTSRCASIAMCWCGFRWRGRFRR